MDFPVKYEDSGNVELGSGYYGKWWTILPDSPAIRESDTWVMYQPVPDDHVPAEILAAAERARKEDYAHVFADHQACLKYLRRSRGS